MGTYYMDYANGNDSWDGTVPIYTTGTTGPKKTTAAVKALASAAGGGHTIWCAPNQIIPEAFSEFAAAGTSGARNMFRVDVECTHFTNGTKGKTTWTGRVAAVALSSNSCCEFDNTNCDYWDIVGCVFRPILPAAGVTQGGAGHCSSVRFMDCEIYACEDVAYAGYANDTNFGNVGYGIEFHRCLLVGCSTYQTVRVHHFHTAMPSSYDVTFNHCLILGSTSAGNGACIQADGQAVGKQCWVDVTDSLLLWGGNIEGIKAFSATYSKLTATRNIFLGPVTDMSASFATGSTYTDNYSICNTKNHSTAVTNMPHTFLTMLTQASCLKDILGSDFETSLSGESLFDAMGQSLDGKVLKTPGPVAYYTNSASIITNTSGSYQGGYASPSIVTVLNVGGGGGSQTMGIGL